MKKRYRPILFFLIFFMTTALIFTMINQKEGERPNLINKLVETVTVDHKPVYTGEHKFVIPQNFDLVKKVMLYKDPQPAIVEANNGRLLSSQVDESDVISVMPLLVEAKTSYTVEYNGEFTAILEMEQDCSFKAADIKTHTRMIKPTERLKVYECIIILKKSDRGTLGTIQITTGVQYWVPKGATGIVDKKLKKAIDEECQITAEALAKYVDDHKNDRFNLRELLDKRKTTKDH